MPGRAAAMAAMFMGMAIGPGPIGEHLLASCLEVEHRRTFEVGAWQLVRNTAVVEIPFVVPFVRMIVAFSFLRLVEHIAEPNGPCDLPCAELRPHREVWTQ